MLISCIILLSISIIHWAAQKLIITDADTSFVYITEFNNKQFIVEDSVRISEYSSACNSRVAHLAVLQAPPRTFNYHNGLT